MLEGTDIATSPVWNHDWIYLAGRRIARIDENSWGGFGYYFLYDDANASLRVMTNSTGNVLCQADYYPFGDPVGAGCSAWDNYQFAGLYADHTGEDGGYSAGHRRFAPGWMRWNSPDPAGTKVVMLTDPQTWNLYMYSHDNPVTFNDPTGLQYCLETRAKNHALKKTQQKLSPESTQAIQRAAKLYHYNAAAFEKAVTTAAARYGIDPNVLVGLAAKESSLDPFRGHGGLFQIQPGRAKDLGIAPKDIPNFEAQIPKAAGALAGAISTFHGNMDLAIASWTLGVAGTQRLFSSGGMQSVRGALLSRAHPEYGRVGPNYIDIVDSYLGP